MSTAACSSGVVSTSSMMLEKKVMIIQKTPMHCMSIRGQELVTGMTWNPFFLYRQQQLFNAVEFIYLAIIFSISGQTG